MHTTSDISKIDPSRPVVALTFDDGPDEQTSHILDILQQHGGHVSFFVTGKKIAGNENRILRAFRMNNEIICHAWDHLDLTKLSGSEIKKQIFDTVAEIAKITGTVSLMLRPPYGNVNKKVKKIARKLGLAIVNWSLDPNDWKTRNAEAVYTYIMSNLKDGDIVLCHDIYDSTTWAMSHIIPELIDQGYQLVTVSDLLLYKYGTIEPGRLYEE